MSKIGIIVAMEEELESILDIMDNIEEKEIYGLTFKTGQIEKNKIIVVKLSYDYLYISGNIQSYS